MPDGRTLPALITRVAVGTFAACAYPTPWGTQVSAEPPVGGSLMFAMARRETDDHLESTGIHQGVLGVEAAMWSREIGIGGEVGYSEATGMGDESTLLLEGLESSIRDVYIGPRAHLPLSDLTAIHLGAGVGSTTVEVEQGTVWLFGISKTSDSDTVTSLYVHAGLSFGSTPGFLAQIDGRFTFGGDAELFGRRVDIDSWQVGLNLGFGF